ncbi:MAG TPA: hypothetical protein VFO52_05595, partial [Longimicrobiales bacterium]|nr:hypothetical protein [Longimicrobiales bacterium]
MKSFSQIVSEAHRRSLWQVLGVYLALSWGAYQVVKELTELFGLPDWVPGLAIVILLVGLPIVLATAFVQEGAPGQNTRAEPEPLIDPTLMPMSATSSAPEPAPEVTPPRPRAHHLFTWQKAVLGGISAFLLLGVTAGGYMGMRNAGVGPFGSLLASGELDSRERILIAEFEPLNGDTMLASTVTEAFRVDFTQSPTVTVMQPKHVREVLQRMSRDVNSRVDAELAHEIAVRDNIKAYLVGELSQAGDKYLISGKLMATRDSRVLASYREPAASADDIIEAIDKLSKKLRNKMGDSFKTIRAEKPLELVSTPSFEALQKYTQGAFLIDVQRNFDAGIALLQEAIALDSGFAMAWRKLGVAYANSDGSEDKRRRAILKAYNFRDRLPDIERLNAEGMYFYSLKRDSERARSAYEMLMDRDPTWPPNNLGIVYMNLRENVKALAAFKRATEVDSTLTSSQVNLVDVLINMNMRDSAEFYTRAYARRFGADRPEVMEKQFYIATAFRDFEQADQLVKPSSIEARSALWRSRLSHMRADMAMLRGQMRESKRHRGIATATDAERGNTATQLQAALWEAAFAFASERNPARARELLEDAVRKY